MPNIPKQGPIYTYTEKLEVPSDHKDIAKAINSVGNKLGLELASLDINTNTTMFKGFDQNDCIWHKVCRLNFITVAPSEDKKSMDIRAQVSGDVDFATPENAKRIAIEFKAKLQEELVLTTVK